MYTIMIAKPYNYARFNLLLFFSKNRPISAKNLRAVCIHYNFKNLFFSGLSTLQFNKNLKLEEL